VYVSIYFSFIIMIHSNFFHFLAFISLTQIECELLTEFKVLENVTVIYLFSCHD